MGTGCRKNAAPLESRARSHGRVPTIAKCALVHSCCAVCCCLFAAAVLILDSVGEGNRPGAGTDAARPFGFQIPDGLIPHHISPPRCERRAEAIASSTSSVMPHPVEPRFAARVWHAAQ